MTERRKGERSDAVRVRNAIKFQTKCCLTDLNCRNVRLFVVKHQESKDDLSLKASRINLPSEHNSLTLFTLKS